MQTILKAAQTISYYAIPLILLLCSLLILAFPKKKLFDGFLEGAEGGIKTAIGLLPSLIALLCAIKLLSASGFTEIVANYLSKLTDKVGIPSEILPLLLTRPFSGSASTAIYENLITGLGPDCFASLCASVIMGSSDTVVYIISVYFSSVGVKNTRYAMPCALAVMIFCIFFGCFVCRLRFN